MSRDVSEESVTSVFNVKYLGLYNVISQNLVFFIVNNEIARMWKEPVVAKYEICHLPGDNRENHESPQSE
jgi:hypothetical protein